MSPAPELNSDIALAETTSGVYGGPYSFNSGAARLATVYISYCFEKLITGIDTNIRAVVSFPGR